MQRVDLIGQRFGKLTVTEKLGQNAHRGMMWLCKCDCGGFTKAQTSDLRKGKVRSCGCNHYKDRQTLNGKPTRLYRIWKNMKKRCYNTRNHDFLYYGARGITVCEKWHEFAPFQKWALANGYTDELTLDRVDNGGNYEPENCRWGHVERTSAASKAKRISYQKRKSNCIRNEVDNSVKGYKTIKTTLGHKIRVKMTDEEIQEREMFQAMVILMPLIGSALMFFLWVKVGG